MFKLPENRIVPITVGAQTFKGLLQRQPHDIFNLFSGNTNTPYSFLSSQVQTSRSFFAVTPTWSWQNTCLPSLGSLSNCRGTRPVLLALRANLHFVFLLAPHSVATASHSPFSFGEKIKGLNIEEASSNKCTQRTGTAQRLQNCSPRNKIKLKTARRTRSERIFSTLSRRPEPRTVQFSPFFLAL